MTLLSLFPLDTTPGPIK